eukprot:g1114.t1 g1114   contig10:1416946-1417740(-)
MFTSPRHILPIFALILLTLVGTVNACNSCLLDLTTTSLFGSKSHHNHAIKKNEPKSTSHAVHASIIPIGLWRSSSLAAAATSSGSSIVANSHKAFRLVRPSMIFKGVDLSAVAYLLSRKLVDEYQIGRSSGTMSKPMQMQQTSSRSFNQNKPSWIRALLSDRESNVDDKIEEEDTKKNVEEKEVMSSSMINAIGFYKQWISPLLPPACRFLPTCSQYGVQAIEEFGPSKGVLLTAWRLARCSPFGGRGYDPPKWPPVAYNYGSY